MRPTQQVTTIASYREAVVELVAAGEPFGDVEEAIDQIIDLSAEQKDALWLLAFSLRVPAGRHNHGRAALRAVL